MNAATPQRTGYLSASMIERRRRILREARRLLAESGPDAFSIRELCARAGVAPRTVYNAFGSLDGLIALAVSEYYLSFVSRLPDAPASPTLVGMVTRTIQVNSRNLEIKPFVSAIMKVYWSGGVNPTVRSSIRALMFDAHLPLLKRLKQSRQLQLGVDLETALALLTTAGYGALADWCAGEFPDAELVPRIVQGQLGLLVGFTRGAAHRQAIALLQAVRLNSASWTALVAQALAQVRPADRAAIRPGS